MTEDDLEQLALKWFSDIGWETICGYDIAPDSDNPLRDSYSEVILKSYLLPALQKNNPHLPESCFEDVITRLIRPESLDLVINNRAFHEMLIKGVPVSYKKDDDIIKDHAFLIDFSNLNNNHFLVVNQFTIKGTKCNRRPDMICFINGLPIAVIELKEPFAKETKIWEAYEQIQTYKDEISDLFIFNEALVISDGLNFRIGSLTANKERFMPWRTISSEKDKPLLQWTLETMIRGFFNPELLLDYIRYFVIFESDNKTIIKKIAGYHQFHAVRQAVDATIKASSTDGDKKAGVVWHTQGSGKSISMCCYAGKLTQRPEMNNPTLVFVTDRTDLDGQLFGTFTDSKALFKDQIPMQAESRDELRELLGKTESGGIIFTTVHKFAPSKGEAAHPVLNERHNIVVISDEAHRSQYGLTAKVDKKTGHFKYGYAKHMRDAIPNASFIGFTGTPLSNDNSDKDTRSVFGEYVSIFDIQDAVDDGATVPIYYESRLAKLDLNHAQIEELSEEVDEIVSEDEESDREKTKSNWSRLEKLVGAAPRLKQIAEDLVAHYEKRISIAEGKAMIVCMSREICANLYNEIVAIRPEWHNEDPEKGQIKVIMTGSASDKQLLQPHIHSKTVKKSLENRFRDPEDSFKMVIVRDMWLTGFDAPSCHTMYVDKPMKDHNLMQAIARVNRVFKDKEGGLVVDYIGIANDLKLALKNYTNSGGKGSTTHDAHEAFAIFLEKLDIIRSIFTKTPQQDGFNLSGFKDNARALLIPAANYILSVPDGKKRYMDNTLAASKAYSLCSTLDEAAEYNQEIAFYSEIKSILANFNTADTKRTQEEKDSTLKRIIDQSVVAEGVIDIFAECNLDKPNIGLLSDEFLEDVANMPQKNLAVELLQKLLNDNIKSKVRNNLVKEKKYSDRLKETLKKYNNRAIEAAQVIEILVNMYNDLKNDEKRLKELGLSNDEIAFYDALANNESAVRELGDKTLKKIAVEITEKLRKSTTVDWQVRDSVRAKLRILVKRTLKKYKYPPDKAEEAVRLVLEQAEVLSNEWSK